jgi:VanZ family protein
MKKKFNICLLVFWLVVIFLLSNQDSGKSQHLSDNLIGKGVDIVASITKQEITPTKKVTIVENMSDKVRSLAHFTEYLILGILVINVLKDYYKLNYKIWLYGLLFCILYAIGDELHQLFISGRSFQYGDIIVDTLGSILGSFGFFKLKTNKK